MYSATVSNAAMRTPRYEYGAGYSEE
jgi:hypothetical protein